MIKYIATFLFGAVVGGCATYFYCVGNIEEKYNQKCKLCRQDHERQINDEKEKTEELKGGIQEIINRTEEEKKQHQEERMNYEKVRTAYDKYSVDEELADDPSFNATIAMEQKERKDRPYVIDDQSFISERPEYEKTYLNYYVEDGVLAVDEDYTVDPTDGVLKDVLDIELVGWNAISKLLERDDDGHYCGDYVYARNESLGMDFEIKRASGHYYE